MRLLLLLSFTLFVNYWVSAQALTLSPEARVSLITVGPGEELYSSFGHSALWIYDPGTGLDNAYSYGTFNFNADNFYVKFLRGTLPYQISVAPLQPQLFYWRSENRSVIEQVLNLTPDQKQRLYQFLETNFLPQNREYQYKFFYDNCSTRLKDAVVQACGDSLQFPGYVRDTLSFRQWIDRYAYEQKPWADFGMDLAIGAPSDEVATPEQATFLPYNLMASFDDSRLLKGGQLQPLVTVTNALFTAVPMQEEVWLTPTVFFWAMAVLVLAYTLWQIQTNKLNFAFDKVLFTIVGLTGWFIVLLWFGTNHGVTTWNYDLLWAFPLWFPLIYSISITNKPAWFQFALIGYAVLLLFATGNLLKHNYVVIPILLTLIIRVYYLNNSLSKIPVNEKKA
ncbi:DUF4105 domain-containing protein [Telluribacter sp.]|jgi:hypothetical protein|uniref:lipoprotein N-acyltransferase Lnb domain-containing protein n=1 Tax=Telluribacter sp. TaxID=1978767 RepID=UPI002E0F139E|nr:DUF4105 domain-containing protein [Telluribacter sp.]